MPSLDTAMSYHRLKKAPLDDMEVFNNLRDLMNYCKDGARYDGQRVVVLNDTIGFVEYTIKNNIPIINMKGSEPIFDSMTFSGESSPTHGLLIYEYNSTTDFWKSDEVFSFNEGKLCIISQLEIFRILDAAGNKTFKFFMERRTRGETAIVTRAWNQNYNPYDDGDSNIINGSSGETINQMSYNNGLLKTNDSDINLMPNRNERKYITRIYVKAEDYYQAYI